MNTLTSQALLLSVDVGLRCARQIVEEISRGFARAGRAKRMISVLKSVDQTFKYSLDGLFVQARRSLYSGNIEEYEEDHKHAESLSQFRRFAVDFDEELEFGMATVVPLDFFPELFSLTFAHRRLLAAVALAERYETTFPRSSIARSFP